MMFLQPETLLSIHELELMEESQAFRGIAALKSDWKIFPPIRDFALYLGKQVVEKRLAFRDIEGLKSYWKLFPPIRDFILYFC